MNLAVKRARGRLREKTPPEPVTDPVESARAAGLRYVSDARPGIRRHKHRGGFRYTHPDGKPVRDQETLARIKSIVIPPAWTDVWIATAANGHLQASGRDVRGRKQSRYHPRWRTARDETKYERMTHFAAVLPAIRERLGHDLALPGLPLQRVLATIVSLMEVTLIRVGNAEYARENHSYGLTTMRNRHVEVSGSKIVFHFQGKSRVQHTIDVADRRLAKIVKRCSDLPGQELFQFVGEDGSPHTIDNLVSNSWPSICPRRIGSSCISWPPLLSRRRRPFQREPRQPSPPQRRGERSLAAAAFRLSGLQRSARRRGKCVARKRAKSVRSSFRRSQPFKPRARARSARSRQNSTLARSQRLEDLENGLRSRSKG